MSLAVIAGAALLAGASLLAPAFAIYARAIRHGGKEPELAELSAVGPEPAPPTR